jgi:DNA polymerase-3 subunit gamma/tau
VAQATGAQAAVPQAKLLDLIEHFSAAESSMKWVADKKLQFDVAVIKALHLLDETSLTDVIETLSGLCHGEVPAPRPVARRAAPVAAVEPAPQKSTPALAPSPVVVSAPAPTAPAPQKKSDDPVDAAIVWESIVADLSKNSFIRFGWLSDGVFDRVEDGKILVRFPESARDSASSYFMEEGVKDIEQRLLKKLGQPVRLHIEFDAAISPAAPFEEPPDRVEEVSSAREESAPAAPAPPPADPMEEFLNDPLIEKALEIFKGTLQTRTA